MSFGVSDFLAGIKKSEQKKAKQELEDEVAAATIKESLKKLSPFDYIKSINSKTEIKHTDDYNPFIVNKLFSMHIDTILNAREMNKLGQYLPNQMQYDYYMNTVRKGRRAWWYKNKTEKQQSEIEIVQILYNVNEERAYELYDMLSEVNPTALREMVDQYLTRLGGR